MVGLLEAYTRCYRIIYASKLNQFVLAHPA